jgi:hypothetical protein
MNNKIDELEALLWSKKSKTFHTEKLKKIVEHGWHSLKEDRDPDYILVGVAESLEEIRSIREALVESRPDCIG